MRTLWPKTAGIVVRGRLFLQSDLVSIRKLVRTHPSWGRTKVSEEVCRLLNWHQENGRLKDRACRVALLKLEALGYLRLPTKKLDRGGQPPRADLACLIHETDVSQMPHSIELALVKSAQQSRLWNSLIARHHYLGLATPVGRLIRYLVVGDGEILGAISFSEAAWSITGRDEILCKLGLDRNGIRSAVVSNNRFLILPHVRIQNLASKVLALATARIAVDWSERFEIRPSFIETFVDPSRFEGTCYRAANWSLIGSTKGFSKQGASHQRRHSPKLLFMYGTTPSSKHFLASHNLAATQRAA